MKQISAETGHRKKLNILNILLLIAATFLFGCHSYERFPGVDFVDTSDNLLAESIVWSPIDPDEVLVVSTDPQRRRDELLIVNTKTSDKTVLQINDTGKLFALDWSPDAKQILFARTSGFVGENGDTLITSKSGDDDKVLMEWVPNAAWSPDGETIAYFRYGQSTGSNNKEIQLHLMDLDTETDRIILALESSGSLGLSWSPDGTKLVFGLGSIKSSNLFVLDIPSQQTVQITDDGLSDSPAWSPYGDVIAYHKFSQDGLSSSLALIRSDGNCEVQIPYLDDVGAPTWLPDKRRLGFIALDGIYTVELEELFVGSLYQKECPTLR
jgi:TolB protein